MFLASRCLDSHLTVPEFSRADSATRNKRLSTSSIYLCRHSRVQRQRHHFPLRAAIYDDVHAASARGVSATMEGEREGRQRGREKDARSGRGG